MLKWHTPSLLRKQASAKYTHACTYVHTHIHTYTHVHTHTNTHTHKLTHAYTHTCPHTLQLWFYHRRTHPTHIITHNVTPGSTLDIEVNYPPSKLSSAAAAVAAPALCNRVAGGGGWKGKGSKAQGRGGNEQQSINRCVLCAVCE